ncbi:MAG: LysM peptidoglycan-binding domain-containing protein [Chloroflexota bacterium]|nr:LysM peptidoglycan-binding domain-containing protein [Chloroflexota bacterium]
MSIKSLLTTPRVLVAASVFALGALLAPATAHAAGPPAGGVMYVVQYGDTLDGIAARFGVPVQSILAANGLATRYPYVGRSIYMPSGYTASAYGASSVYEVEPGDTLAGIARRFGVSVFELMRVNHIFNPNFIFAEMRLLVPRAANYAPGSYSSYRTYAVQVGDTLSSIALRFGTSVYALMVANNIPNPNLIFAGMRLAIPGYSTASASGSPAYGNAPSYAYPSAAPPMPGATPMPGSGAAAVALMNIAYNPRSITVHAGTKVVWTNRESSAIQHTVTSGAPGAPSGAFDSGTLNSGQVFQFTFSSPGTFAYYCRIHGAAMTGTITVVP